MTSEHDWFEFRPRLTCCRKCGIVRRADGTNKPCKGWGRLREMERTWPLPNQADASDEVEEQGLAVISEGTQP
jgi:hypothetical protein